MKIFNALVLSFYTLLILLLGATFTSISLGVITEGNIGEMVSLCYSDANLRLGLGIGGLLLVIIGLGVVQLAINRVHREKTISFENPDGQITISLSAIEDFIRRLFRTSTDIKELRPLCVVGKKGIEISNKVALWSDTKIPEATEKIQSVIKSRLQQILGTEEAITVKVNVVKIAAKEIRRPRTKEEPEETEMEAPYQYRD